MLTTRTLLPALLGLAAVCAAPQVAQADPQDSRRRVFVYDGHSIYYGPARDYDRQRRHRRYDYDRPRARRVVVPRRPQRTTTVVVQQPQRHEAPHLLSPRELNETLWQLSRYRHYPARQLQLLGSLTCEHVVTVDQAYCLAAQLETSRDRLEALVALYRALDTPCACLDYVGRVGGLLECHHREALQCRIEGLEQRPKRPHHHG